MARRPARELLASLDRDELAQFQAGIRKRYSDEEIVEQLLDCARRLRRSPSMREFSADPETSVHPQTVIEHFGSWNAAKRTAGLVPRRFATREELRGSLPSKSLYWHTFGSLTNALREAGFDVPVGEERLERAVDQGSELALQLGHLPKFQDWATARKEDASLLTEWQVYRMFDVRRGAWSTFQYLIRERLLEEGYEIGRDGRISAERGKRRQQP